MASNLNTLFDSSGALVGFIYESRTSDTFGVTLFSTEQEARAAREAERKGVWASHKPCSCGQPPAKVMARYCGEDNRSLLVCLTCMTYVDDPEGPEMSFF